MRAYPLVVALVGCMGGAVVDPAVTVPRTPQIPLVPQVSKLPNGMTVMLVPDASADLVSVMVRYNAGTIDTPPGQESLAHLAAHVSYVSPTGNATLWDQLDRVGTWIDITPDVDHTDFTVQVQPQHLAEVLRLEAQRMSRRCDGLEDHWFEWVKRQVRDEVRVHPTRLTNRSVFKALYPAADPYNRAYDATPDGTSALTRDQTCAFLDQYYTPANATVVVSGPVDAAAFQRAIDQSVRSIPARPTHPRAARAELPTAGFSTKVSSDVTKPTLVVAWTLPRGRSERAVMLFAVELLGEAVKANVFEEDNFVGLWMTDADLDVMTQSVRQTLQTGLAAPTSFERRRSGRITNMLARLDNVRFRLPDVAEEPDLDAPFEAVAAVDLQHFNSIVADDLAWSKARVIGLESDGSRPAWRPTTIGDPRHALIGPSQFPDAGDPQIAMSDSRVPSNARTFRLANGMQVILAPSSPIPVVDIRLAFLVGSAAESPDHRGTATVALAALQGVAGRGAHSQAGEWAVGQQYGGADFDSGGIGVRGAVMNIDHLFEQFEGLSDAKLELADIQKAHDILVKTANAPVQRVWDEQAAVRSSVYGSAHRYGQFRQPKPADVGNFDAREVEAFYRKYLQPTNATLIVAGGFDPDVVTKLVHRAFDRWQGKGEVVATAPPKGTGKFYASSEQSRVVTLTIDWPTGPTDEHFEARMLLANMLHLTSPRVMAAHVPHRDGGKITLLGRFDPATAAREVAALRAMLPRLGSGGDRERAAFVASARRGARAALDNSTGGWSSRILFAIQNGKDTRWLAGTPRRMAQVSYADVSKLASTELALDRATWSISGPHDAVAEVYEALGVEPTWLDP